jgi:hypothetical protein
VIGYVLFTYMLLDQMSCAQNKIALPARLWTRHELTQV